MKQERKITVGISLEVDDRTRAALVALGWTPPVDAGCGCPGCGEDPAVAHDPDTDGWWEVDTSTVCYACAALERWHENGGHEHMPPGAKVAVRLESEYQRRGVSA